MSFRRLILVLLFTIIICALPFGIEQYRVNKEIERVKEKISNTINYQSDKMDRYFDLYNKSELEVEDIIQLVNEDIDLIKDERYQYLLNIINDPFYIKKNLKKYMEFFAESHYKYDLRTTIAIVNSLAYKEPYSEVSLTNMEDKELMLCNRYNGLPADYKGVDLVDVDKNYSTLPGAKMNKDAYEAFLAVKAVCEPLGHKIFINGTHAFRDYKKQQEAFDSYVKDEGLEVALVYAAKPGFSEHQTGYAMDIMFDFVNNEVYSYKDYEWMLDNCWDFGFIVRYPEGCEMITHNDYEPWHYRYVGKEVSKYIHEHNITFDEYYNYFMVDNSITTEEFVKMFN